MRVGRAVRRQRHESAAFVQRRDGSTFATNERVPCESLREHAIEAYQRTIHIIAAQSVQRIAGAIERVDAEIGIPIASHWSAGANHAHDQTAVLLLIMRNPAFFFTAGGKDAA